MKDNARSPEGEHAQVDSPTEKKLKPRFVLKIFGVDGGAWMALQLQVPVRRLLFFSTITVGAIIEIAKWIIENWPK